MHIQQFPEVFLQLQEEIGFHPALVEQLGRVPANEFEQKIAVIAAYCEVLLDGIYDQKDIEKIADICLRRLRKNRTIIIG